MKKIFSLISLLAAVIVFTACSSDNNYTTSDNYILEVVQAETTFGPEASTGQIVVNSDQSVVAFSSEDWCTVSVQGNTVNVSVTDYAEIASRNALVTITSGARTVDVPVHQNGVLFATKAPSVISTDYSAQKFEYEVKTNMTVDLTTSDDWIKAEIVGDNLVITLSENTTGAKRTGTVSYSYGVTSGEIQITQIDFSVDILGDYELWYSKSATSAQWAYIPVTFKYNSIDFTIGGVDFSIPVKFTNGTNPPYEVTIADEQYVGLYDPYYCYLAFDCYGYKLLTRYPQYFFSYCGTSTSSITLAEETYDDGTVIFGGAVEGMMELGGEALDEGDIDTWYLLAMSAQEYTQENVLGPLLTMYYPQFEKVPADAAASRRSAPLKVRNKFLKK